jgi:hypothetical protein
MVGLEEGGWRKPKDQSEEVGRSAGAKPAKRGILAIQMRKRKANLQLTCLMVSFVLSIWIPKTVLADGFDSILKDRSVAGGQEVIRIGQAEMVSILEYGIERDLMVFEVFDRLILHLVEAQAVAEISGQTLRKVAETYDLGGDRVEALLPVSEVSSIRLGKTEEVDSGFLDVTLTGRHTSTLENERKSLLNEVTINLDEQYGFTEVTAGNFEGGYGAGVKRRLFGVKMDRLEIYGTNKIAIHVKGFARPKRWRIRRIVLKGS